MKAAPVSNRFGEMPALPQPRYFCPRFSLLGDVATTAPYAANCFPAFNYPGFPERFTLEGLPSQRSVNVVRPPQLNESPRRNFGRIAIVDDNPDDIFILQRQLRRLGITCPIATFSDGHDAMAFLRQTAENTDPAALPQILFLDINMPGATGFSVLCWVREQDALKNLKVVILSGTSDPGDVALATALTADAYVAKQPSMDHLVGILQRFAPDLLPHPAEIEPHAVHAGHGTSDSGSPFANAS